MPNCDNFNDCERNRKRKQCPCTPAQQQQQKQNDCKQCKKENEQCSKLVSTSYYDDQGNKIAVSGGGSVDASQHFQSTDPGSASSQLIPLSAPSKDIQSDNLFGEIGLPTEFGIPQYIDLSTPSNDFLKTIAINNEYEQNVDSWFSSTPKPPQPIPGCTNPLATNYNPAATEDDGSCILPPPSLLKQYSPHLSDQDILAQTSSAANQTSQDPNGILWINPTNWVPWDGVPLDTTGKTNTQLCSWLFPKQSYALRGLKERFYQVNPFADNTAPTVAEIDNWNIEVIKFYRELLGVNRPVQNDARLYLECRWSDERKYTTQWDAAYPPTGAFGDAYGPCHLGDGTSIDTATGHCGDSFFPSTTDRTPYITAPPYNNTTDYPELINYNSRASQATGIQGINAGLPWSIKLATVIGRFICTEGLTGHPGPYVGAGARQYFGCSWWTTTVGTGQTANFRGKWR